MTLAYIALGSNLGGPLQQVNSAVQALTTLPGTSLLAHSPWYGSTAIGPGAQNDYVNGVAAINTALSAPQLLAELQRIERSFGRERKLRWAPRTLDLDILFYGEERHISETLHIPHPRLGERNFVIIPLLDLAPDMILPDGTSLAQRAMEPGRDGLWPLDNQEQHD